MLISFGSDPNVDALVMRNCTIERVKETKLLGVIIRDDLRWDSHISYFNKKASKRLYFLRCLKRAGLSKDELLSIYISLVRSICEYACPVWSTCLTKGLSDILESIQKRALRIILPEMNYEEACEALDLPLLSTRRSELCKKIFLNMTKPNHKLHDLLPQKNSDTLNFRKKKTEYPLPQCKTNRYENSFVPYCLINYQ